MDFRISILGFGVGVLVGLTGMGGGAVMTPMLILLKLGRPVVAVGTDLVWSALTKLVGATVHARQRTVDYQLVKRLAMGSIPGALVGLALLAHLRSNLALVDRLVVRTLGIALIVVACSLLLRSVRPPRPQAPGEASAWESHTWLIPLLGGVVGFLVSLTSVGSGSLIVASLVAIYPRTPLRRIVGSDIFHALLLVGVSALGHLEMGSINGSLLVMLLVGSIPGVWLGSRMSTVFPEKILRPTLATTLLFLGYKLL